MRSLLLYLCLFIMLHSNLSAQETMKFPEMKMKPFPEKGIYRFPAFTEGTVIMRNGTSSSQKLNFNISLNEMHFISDKGDTLCVAEPVSLKFIIMQGTRFYYDKGYYQIIDSAGEIMLAFTQLLSLQQHRTNAYGMTEPHEGVRTYSFYASGGKTDPMGADEKVTVTAREVYFFGDKYGHFSKTNKAFIFDHFDKHQERIKNFITANHTNFNRYSDLLKLMQFCRDLQ